MAHSRRAIRKAVVTAVTGLTTTGTNVVSWRLHAIDASERPQLAVMVAALPETVSDTVENQYGYTEIRDLPVTLEARVEQASASTHADALDTLDDICQEVEIAMVGNAALSALVVDVMLESTEISMAGDGERPAALATMEWLVRYSVDRSSP